MKKFGNLLIYLSTAVIMVSSIMFGVNWYRDLPPHPDLGLVSSVYGFLACYIAWALLYVTRKD